MIIYRADKERNILFISITGQIQKDKMAELLEQFAKKCAELRECFTIINDISLLKITSESELEIMNKATTMMREKFHIGRVIRIIGTNTSYEKILKQSDTINKLEDIHYVSTKKKALETLYKF